METIKARLAAGKQVNIFAVGAVPSPAIIEMAAMHGGFHGVWIDQEHAALPQQQIDVLVLAARASGLDSYVRLAPTDYATVMRGMETGAGGVMAAQVRTVAKVRQIVAWSKYPPLGLRGVNTANREGGYATVDLAEYIPRINRDKWLAIQIETAESVEDVEEIAAVPGVDHLFVGPADLSVALGVPGDYMHPKCIAALEKVSAATAKAGITWGIMVRGKAHADLCRSLGAKLFALTFDLGLLNAGFRAVRAEFADFVSE